MKKLKKKMFWVLFSILSIFVLTICFFFNYKMYSDTYNQVSGYLNEAKEAGFKGGQFLQENTENENTEQDAAGDETTQDLQPKSPVFFTSMPTVLVIYNDDVPYLFYGHTAEFNQSELNRLSYSIHPAENARKTYIPNLYQGGLAYAVVHADICAIVSLDGVQKQLLDNLVITILVLAAAEVILSGLCMVLTRWMVRPIEETFEKQKQFIADSSHELKTPLAVIMASAEAMEYDPSYKWISNIQQESRRMNTLITRLLDLTRSENINTQSFSMQNISKIIEIALLPYESIIFEKGDQLEYNLEDNVQLYCDPEQIKQIVIILIDNAIQHTTPGGQIRLSLYKQKDFIYLKVENQGEGIPKGDEEKIFERFYRADDSRSRSSGRYGLGLAIAKNIALSHSGSISACSKDGWTTFTVRFKTAMKGKDLD